MLKRGLSFVTKLFLLIIVLIICALIIKIFILDNHNSNDNLISNDTPSPIVKNQTLNKTSNLISDICLPVYEENNARDSGRFNIVFVGVGFTTSNDLKNSAKRVIDLENTAKNSVGSEGLMQIPVFKNNLNKFNFWYVNRVLTSSDNSPQGIWSILYQNNWIDDCQNILPNRVIPVFIYPGQNSSIGYPYASRGRSYVTLYDCIDERSNCNSEAYPHLQNANIHELLHTIPCLEDEYGKWGSANPNNQPFSFTGNLSTIGGLQFYVGDSYSDCIVNAPWKSMIGNNCGVNGVIDCFQPECNQPLSFINGIDTGDSCCNSGSECNLEIGCFEGGRYADKNIWRSSSGGILRNTYEGTSVGSDYLNLWDQEIIKKVISKGPAVDKIWKEEENYQLDCDVSSTGFA